MLLKFEVGQKFPIDLKSHGEGFRLSTNGDSFDIYAILDTPTSKEVRAFKQEILKIGVYRERDIPFIVGYFQSGTEKMLEFDAPYNVHKIHYDERSRWLDAEANMVALYLIDANTHILKAMRVIGIDFMKTIKDTLRMQETTYINHREVDIMIDNIYKNISIEKMIKLSYLQTFMR